MSLILEALRKSEAERRRGQVPDLHAAPAPGAAPLRDELPTWLWLALAIATAAVLALALWLAGSAPPLPSPAPEVPVAAPGLSVDRSLDADGDAGTRDEPIGTDGSSGTPEDRASAGALPTLSPPPGRQPDAAPTPAAAAATGASTTPARAQAAATAAGPAAAAPAPAPATSPAPTPAVAATPARTRGPDAAVSTSAAVAPVAATPAASPLRLSDLSAAQRQQLPPLKMSMHMYSPTQRFAIIDGSRVGQGDRIGDAVVEEITATGVLLDWQGLRLQIPLP